MLEHIRNITTKDFGEVFHKDLDEGGDLLAVVLVHHVGLVGAPEDTGPHADGQVGGRHHVLLKQQREVQASSNGARAEAFTIYDYLPA